MVDGDSSGSGLAPFTLDRLAVARVQRGQEIVKSRVAFMVPVKLLVVALQEAVRPQKLRFRLAGEGDVHGGGIGRIAERLQAARERGSDLLAIDPVADQQPWTGRWRKGHRGLQLWIIASARALIGIRPAAVEDIFALGMRFQIAGHDAGDFAVEPCQEMPRTPAGAGTGRAGGFGGGEKCMRNEWVIGRLAGIALSAAGGQRVEVCETVRVIGRIGAGVPIRSRYVGYGGNGFDADFG